MANVPPYVTQPYVLAQGYGHSFFGVVVAAIPLLTILMSIPMLGVWPTRRQSLGVLGGLVCLWFVVDDGFDRGMSLGPAGAGGRGADHRGVQQHVCQTEALRCAVAAGDGRHARQRRA